MQEMVAVMTDKAPRAIGPYSQAIRCGGFLFTSGQVALDPATGELVRGSVEAEVGRVIENLSAVLQAGGSALHRVVKTTVYLIDMGDFQAMNGVYAHHFGAARPARSTVQVTALPRGARVEIEAIALTD